MGRSKLYTFGYHGKSVADLKTLAESLGAVVADIRLTPRSRIPQWNIRKMASALGEACYRHLPELGNRNYKNGGPIEIAELEPGLAKLWALLQASPVILVCACAHVEKCHRRVVADALAERRGVEAEDL